MAMFRNDSMKNTRFVHGDAAHVVELVEPAMRIHVDSRRSRSLSDAPKSSVH